MDLEALALAVDDRVRLPAAERREGRLYAVRCEPAPEGSDPDHDEPGDTAWSVRGGDDPDDGGDGAAPAAGCPPRPPAPTSTGAVVLELLAEGEARTLPQKVRPPTGAQAIALASGVWVAPMEDDGPSLRPSQHPERRRAHLTVVVGVEDGRDGADISVLRYGDGSPTVMRGGIGVIHQRMLRCWSRRPDGPWASPPRSASAA